jgi:Ca2+-binding EF-hand superfamily protein
MFSRRNVFTVAAAALVGVAAPALAASKTDPLVSFDTDNDGTVDLDEAKKAASALFDKLDTDKDGTLDFKELHGRLTHLEFAAADPDNDRTLTKDEFLAVVEKRFGAADRDNDGKLSAAELKKGAGKSLSKLLSSP